MRKLRSILALLAVVFVAVSCLEGKLFVPQIDEVYFEPSLGVDLAASTQTASGLYYRDITVGGGTEVLQVMGDSVGVRYRGYLRNGAAFDSNTTAALPLRFKTGSNAVIDGFDEGVRGMRVGGRRQLIIPPALGYGSQGSAAIPSNSILVFDVTLQVLYSSDSTPPPPAP
jgi:FKBP-type peptidyl-prolyl cis-trans isomerase FkpA